MPLFGSHLSIAGGYHKAVLKAVELNLDCLQVFTKSNNQWRGKPISDAEAECFHSVVGQSRLASVVAHNSYLINLASANDLLWQQSIAAMIQELERAARLGIATVVAHPGAHCGQGEAEGLERVSQALDMVFEQTTNLPVAIALETTAGQGSCLGHQFEHLGQLIKHSSKPDRLRACFDTCHVFAAGYKLAPKRAYQMTLRSFDRTVGIERLAAIHLNDSKRPLGSRVDRHEHIGRGHLTLEPFAILINDRQLRDVPMILETPKEIEPESNQEWDAINLETLRELVRAP